MTEHLTEATAAQVANASANKNSAWSLPAEGNNHTSISKRKAFAFAAVLIIIAVAATAVAWTVYSPAPSNPSTQNTDSAKPVIEPNDSTTGNKESTSTDVTSAAETSEPAATSTNGTPATALAPNPADNDVSASTGEAGTSAPDQQSNPSSPANAANKSSNQAATENGKCDSSKAPDNDIKAG